LPCRGTETLSVNRDISVGQESKTCGRAALKELEIIDDARRQLGADLAAHRRAAGLSQAELASFVSYSRSTVANVETGRQHVPADFWERADLACHAGGALATANNDVEALVRQEREKAARQATSSGLVLAGNLVVGGVSGPASKEVVAASVEDGSWLDAVARAASEARGYAQKAAVTEVGPGTVEQLTADVIRLSRAYVSASPLPLFAAMHQGMSRVQAALDQKLYPAQARDLNFLAGALCGLMATRAWTSAWRRPPMTWLAPPGLMAGSSTTPRSRDGPAAPRPSPRSGTSATSTPRGTPRMA